MTKLIVAFRESGYHAQSHIQNYTPRLPALTGIRPDVATSAVFSKSSGNSTVPILGESLTSRRDSNSKLRVHCEPLARVICATSSEQCLLCQPKRLILLRRVALVLNGAITEPIKLLESESVGISLAAILSTRKAELVSLPDDVIMLPVLSLSVRLRTRGAVYGVSALVYTCNCSII
jgi:hypothetical protein